MKNVYQADIEELVGILMEEKWQLNGHLHTVMFFSAPNANIKNASMPVNDFCISFWVKSVNASDWFSTFQNSNFEHNAYALSDY